MVCSHGNALSLFLNSIEPAFGFEEWRAMTNPALYHLEYHDGTWLWEDRQLSASRTSRSNPN